jgi:hypothetical protein
MAEADISRAWRGVAVALGVATTLLACLALTRQASFRRRAMERRQKVREPIAPMDRPAPSADAGEPAGEAGWYGHQDGRITGSGVAPGAGDSEAGTSAINS